MASCCLLPGNDDDLNPADDVIPHFWRRDIDDHQYGQFSMAVLQSNEIIEDQSQVEVAGGPGNRPIFCGVYDGHGGDHASTYVLKNLYPNFRRLVKESGMISKYTVLNSFIETENGFLDTVQRAFPADLKLATSGSCCLVGILTRKRILHYAHLGDSRAVLGYVGFWGNIQAEQLTHDHNVNDKRYRQEYEASQPGRNGVVVKVDGTWLVNRWLEVSSCLGDGTFKRDNLAIDAGQLHVHEKFHRPLINAVPSVQARELHGVDRFIIFATKGLWDLLSNEEAVRVVHNGPRQGAAKRLVKKALRMKANNLRWTYDRLKNVPLKLRRHYIDDISVIVLFVDHELLQTPRVMPANSVWGFVSEAIPPDLNNLADNAEGLVNPEENPADDAAALVNQEDNPADNAVALLNQENNPADDAAALVNQEDNPADNAAALLNQENNPADNATALVNQEDNPADDAAALVNQENNPEDDVAALVNQENNPADDAAALVNQEDNPEDNAAAFVNQENNPADDAAALVNQENNLVDDVAAVANQEDNPPEEAAALVNQENNPADDHDAAGLVNPADDAAALVN